MGTLTHVATLSRMPARGGVSPPAALDALMADAEPWICRAAAAGARVLCFSEAYPELPERGRTEPEALVEPATGGSLLRVADLARRYDIDIVWPRNERDETGRHNVCIYVDRHGEVLGRYIKMFPTIGELEAGTVPGDCAVVLETEYGRVGFAICFDLNFAEVREAYRALQPDLIFFASAYHGGIKVPYWAVDLGCYMVSSIRRSGGQIVDRRGRVLEHSRDEALATAPINLNSVQLHQDDNDRQISAMLAKYGDQLRLEFATDEGRFQLSSTGPAIDDLIAEFGLMRLEDYFSASRARRLEALRVS